MGSSLTHTPRRPDGPPGESGGRDPLSIPGEVKASIRILIVDDERTLRESCASVLQMDGYNVTLIGRGEEALEVVKRRKFDIILVDLYMSQTSGMDILRSALEFNRDTIVVVMTGNPSVTSSIEALRAGAWDYLPKPFSATHLQVLIGRASHAVMVARETRDLKQQLATQGGHSDKISLIGISPLFRKAVDLARKVAATDASVFISGESGTGKEVIAQFIHQHSRRASRTLVPINCAALPEPLLESEMFGHRKGAFTGADRDKPGLLETANGGTLFLDELTEMSMPLQAKLLRVIQDGVVRRVGSETQDAVVDVRYVAATNRDPQEAVNQGILRGDLFYRLRVVPIKLPPLRKRPEDIPLLANHFLTYYWQRHRQMGDRLPKLTDASIAFLRSRPWRGNVRELQNVIEHVAVLAEPDQMIQPNDIPIYEDGSEYPSESAIAAPVLDEAYHVAKDRVVAQFEKEYLTRLIGRAGGNMSKAARLANIDRTTLYRLMDKHNFQRDDLSGSAE
ncbi:MAG: sigma-54-dependent Fis family transcriptional regulator [Gemmatimonadetes bacterium]|nr:sigma-54-dependent Fis family transcriptional regulator [Gemmatimonadota bacterium]MBP6670086.1 sigma-54-dependent Fis family transcriptional regulator [Gemmatimonadales bacterium]MBK6778040.1 sigma-54-dependent Fis family transcriptional regulator [Gemmatimonadota bacterium]MBK7349649.1 sigma-54-dependent Fis family transcriptional regulator [Gemmatimonadota bacterium]MBK7784279.1 sigma-54-dependent Fis family transcriptional regulator [Gemmatimonadota bacterium]